MLVLYLHSVNPHDLCKKGVCVSPPCPLMNNLPLGNVCGGGSLFCEALETDYALSTAVVAFIVKLNSPAFGLCNHDMLKIIN